MLIHAIHQWKEIKRWKSASAFSTQIIHTASFWVSCLCIGKRIATRKQNGKMGKNRSRVGMYLGPSRTHARSVHHILSIKTGLVSPQFHVNLMTLNQ